MIVPLRTGVIAGYRIGDGEPAWRTSLAPVQPLASDGERAYVATRDGIHALAAASGEVLWREDPGAALTAPPLAHGGWVVAAAAGQLLALRAADGAVVWRKDLGPVHVRPALDGDLLVVSVGAPDAGAGRVVALDVTTGAVRWERAIDTAPTEPRALGGRVYVGTGGKTFLTLDARSGWRESEARVGAVPRGAAAADDDHVYFTALDNTLRAVDRADGALEWWRPLPYRPAAGPALIAGHVIVPGYERTLPAFRAADGTPAGQVTFSTLLAALPLVVSGPQGAWIAGAVGNLENEWRLVLLEPSLVPAVEVRPLAALPGTAVPLPSLVPR